MKIAFINGSPKIKDSSSDSALKMFKRFFDDSHTILQYNFTKPHAESKDIEEISKCEAIVIAFPLYVDGIPSHLLSCLHDMELFFKTIEVCDIKVYAIANCGFYEGYQNRLALEMIENWCEKCGTTWGQGIGIGAGGMLPMLANISEGKGPSKNVWIVLRKLSKNVVIRDSGENIFISPNFPRVLYKLAGEAGWRKQIKANGLKRKDLFLRR